VPGKPIYPVSCRVPGHGLGLNHPRTAQFVYCGSDDVAIGNRAGVKISGNQASNMGNVS